MKILAVHPYPPAETVAAHISALTDAQIVEAFAGGPVRVLAINEKPPFLCDHAYITEPASLPTALRWVLDPTLDDPRASLIIDQLRDIFGPGVREVFPSALEELVDEDVRPDPFREVRRYDPND